MNSKLGHDGVEVEDVVNCSGLGCRSTVNFLENVHEFVIVSRERASILLGCKRSLIQLEYAGLVGAVVECTGDGLPDFLGHGESNKALHQ